MPQFRWIDHRPLLCPIAVVLAVFQLASIAQGVPVFHATRLQIPEGVFNVSFDGLSEQGDVFGITIARQVGPQGFDGRAARFTADGVLAWDRPAFTGGSAGFSAVGSTNGGVFFGDNTDNAPLPTDPSGPALARQNAATLTEPDHYRFFPRPAEGRFTYTRGASADGQWLCGDQRFYDGSASGIIFGPDGSYSLTGTFLAFAIGNAGLAVGVDSVSRNPAIWTPNGGVRSLPSLPIQDYSTAFAHIVTESGLVEVNVVTDPADPTIARQFIFDGTSYQELEQPGERSFVYHVNNNGWATGYVLPAGESDSTKRIASLWIDGKWYNLNDLTAGLGLEYLEEAQAINDLGQIVVDGPIFENNVAAYLLTPIVPEPTAIAIVLTSIPLSRRRR